MAKAYWIAFYKEISDPDKMAAYGKLASPAIAAGGGTFLARGVAAHAYENDARAERTVLIEFPDMAAAVATHDSPGYQAALAALKGGAIREIRFVDAV